MRFRRAGFALVLAAVGVAIVLSLQAGQTPLSEAQSPATPTLPFLSQPITDGYIVVFRNNVNVNSYVSTLEQRYGFSHRLFFHTAIKGFAATITAQVADLLRKDPNVAFVEQDSIMRATTQVEPTGLRRIQADQNATAAINGAGPDLNVNVAIIDTGVDTSNSELHVLGGFAQYAQTTTSCFFFWCTTSTTCGAATSSYVDQNGHGTHVAGTIAARDNTTGVVGVAPGAGIYAVRVLGPDGSGCTSDVIAGVDWVAQHASSIGAANLSLGGGNSAALCNAINSATSAGVVFVVAAGNDGADAGNTSPANCVNAITVAAVADYNGQSGGGGSPASGCNYGADDSLASFSNYGSVVDIAAPGACILSTVPTSCSTSICSSTGLNTLSGTSMATPHVTGAVLLDILQHGKPSNLAGVNSVLSRLLSSGFPKTSACGYTTSGAQSLTVPLLNLGPACSGTTSDPTSTSTFTPTPTSTRTPTPTPTNTPPGQASPTSTNTPTRTPTPTSTSTNTPTRTPTPTSTFTPVAATPTRTPTPRSQNCFVFFGVRFCF